MSNLKAAAAALNQSSQSMTPKSIGSLSSKLQALSQALAQQGQPATVQSQTTNSIKASPQTNMEKIKTQIKTERNLQGLTQRQLAVKAQMSQGSITRAERHGWVSIWCLLKITNALGKELIIN